MLSSPIVRRGNGAPIAPSLPAMRLLDEHETAELLNVKVATLRRWRWGGKELPFVKIGGAVRYDPAEVQAYIASKRRLSTSDPGLDTARKVA